MPPSLVAQFHRATAPAPAMPAASAESAPGAGVDAPACPSCGAARPERYCPRCGERRVEADDYTLRHFAAHAVDQLFNLDGTLWRTGRALVTRPGLLTAEYLAGRRTRYTRPLQLFVLVNLAFFLATGAAGTFRFRLAQYAHGGVGGFVTGDTARVQALVAAKARRDRIAPAEVERRFDAASAAQQSVWLFVAPVVAGVVALLYTRRRRPYVHHLVFAVHFLTFLLVATGGTISVLVLAFRYLARPLVRTLAVWSPGAAAATAAGLTAFTQHEWFAYPLLAWLAAYLVFALRRAYADSWRWAVARAVVLAVLVTPLFMLYRDLLFIAAYLLG